MSGRTEASPSRGLVVGLIFMTSAVGRLSKIYNFPSRHCLYIFCCCFFETSSIFPMRRHKRELEALRKTPVYLPLAQRSRRRIRILMSAQLCARVTMLSSSARFCSLNVFVFSLFNGIGLVSLSRRVGGPSLAEKLFPQVSCCSHFYRTCSS